ncbi:MAG TPA: PLxRFG domain-containing protein [Gaiellaceae bacterium]|nr:PLxRFG domain-containing protein [Gaiellaceae bacterium]
MTDNVFDQFDAPGGAKPAANVFDKFDPPKPVSGGYGALDIPKEIGAGALTGTGAAISGIGEVGRRIARGIVKPLNDVYGTRISEPVNAFAGIGGGIANLGTKLADTESDAAKAAKEKPIVEGDITSPSSLHLGEGAKSPMSIALSGAGLLGQAAPLLAGGLEARGAKMAPEVLDALPSIAQKLTRGEALTAPERTIATTAEKATREAARRTLGAGAAIGGVQGAEGSAEAERSRIAALPEEELAAIPAYAEKVQSGIDPKLARQQVADAAAEGAFATTLPVATAAGLVSTVPFIASAGGPLGRIARISTLRRAAAGVALEAPTQAALGAGQSIASTTGANLATGEKRDVTENTASAAGAGAALGAIFGGIGSLHSAPRAQKAMRGETARAETPEPETGTEGGKTETPTASTETKAAAAETPVESQTATAASPTEGAGAEAAVQPQRPPAVPWIDQGTGEIRKPYDFEVKDAFHQLFANAETAGAGMRGTAASRMLAEEWGVPRDRLIALRKDALAERNSGFRAGDERQGDLVGAETPGQNGETAPGAAANGEAEPAAPVDTAASDRPGEPAAAAEVPEPAGRSGADVRPAGAEGLADGRQPAVDAGAARSEPSGEVRPGAGGVRAEGGAPSGENGRESGASAGVDRALPAAGGDVQPEGAGVHVRSVRDNAAAPAPEAGAREVQNAAAAEKPAVDRSAEAVRGEPAAAEKPAGVDAEGARAKGAGAGEPSVSGAAREVEQAGRGASGSAPVRVTEPGHVDEAARAAASHPENALPEPTEAQKEAGNYQKGHADIGGLHVSIETPAGAKRHEDWPALKHSYGYVKRSEGADGEHVDVFLGPHAHDTAKKVYVVDQIDPKTGKFDEHKAMVGFQSGLEARRAYAANYSKGWKGFGGIHEMPFEAFKTWVKSPDAKLPALVAREATPLSVEAQDAAAAKQRADQKRAPPPPTGDTAAPEFKKWFAGSKAIGPKGEPVRVFRGQHGEDAKGIQTRAPSITFTGDRGVAETYSKSPNNRKLDALAKNPHTLEAYVSIKHPIVEGDDPFVDMSAISKAIGYPAARKLAERFGEQIQRTNNWEEHFADKYDSVKALLAKEPKAVDQLYLDAYHLLDDPAAVKAFKAAGYDGAIHDGNGEGAKTREYRVFSQDQVKLLEPEAPIDRQSAAKEQPASAAKPVEKPEVVPPKAATPKPKAVPEKPKSDTAGEIRDVGEKIGGARKDTWASRNMAVNDLAALNERELHEFVKKDAVYKRPDYAALAKTSDRTTAFKIKTIYDAIPNPGDRLTRAEFERYVDAVGRVRDVLDGIKSGEDMKGGVLEKMFGKDILTGSGFMRRLNREAEGYKAVETLGNKFLRTVQSGPYEDSKIGRKLSKLPDWPGKATKEATGEGARLTPERPSPLSGVLRTGNDYRGGKDVAAEDFRKAFGFRGVEFGNWTDQKDRQASINHAYDALHDMADALGIPPQAIGLNGQLGMAFGARGKGSAAAHYEPTRTVINLTKTSGAGSVAHEWAHALDDFFGKQSSSKSFAGKNWSVADFLAKFSGNRLKADATQQLRPEVIDGIKGVMEAIDKRARRPDEVIKEANDAIPYTEQQAKKNGDLLKTRLGDKLTPELGNLIDTAVASNDHGTEFERLRDGVMSALDIKTEGKLYTSTAGVALHNLGVFLQRRAGWGQRILRATERPTDDFGRVPTDFKAASAKLGPYWVRPHELFARSFEAFVKDKIDGVGGARSDYLVHPSKRDRPATNPLYPYPAGAERQTINAAYQRFIDSLQTRETPKGTEVFDAELEGPADDGDRFYSALARSAGEAKGAPQRAPASAWRQWLDGAQRRGEFKQSEREWMGLDQWLNEHKGPVTRQEFQDFVKASTARVSETLLGTDREMSKRIFTAEAATQDANQAWRDASAKVREEVGDKFDRDESGNAMLYYPRSDSLDHAMSVLTEHYELTPKEERLIRGMWDARTEYHSALRAENDLKELRLPPKYASYATPGGDNYRELLIQSPDLGTVVQRRLGAYMDAAHEAEAAGDTDAMDRIHDEALAYSEAHGNATVGDAAYTDPHFRQPNVLAHVRMDDRVSPDGKKTLHIQEIQSDLHQQGRRQGYQTPVDIPRKVVTAERAKLKDVFDPAYAGESLESYIEGRNELAHAYAKEQRANAPDRITGDTLVNAVKVDGKLTRITTDLRDQPEQMAKRLQKAYDDNREVEIGMAEAGNNDRVPDAPFKKEWPLLAFKRALREAVENGYDRVTWDTGDTQNKRYDLSKHIDSLHYNEGVDGGTLIGNKEGRGSSVLDKTNVTPEQLADHVGKDVAEKLMAQEPDKHGLRSLEGVQLQVGGKGMRGFYDQMLPTEVQKYVKQWGGKVGESTMATKSEPGSLDVVGADGSLLLRTDYDSEAHALARENPGSSVIPTPGAPGVESVHSLDITPAMRESVMKGQPMYDAEQLREAVKQTALPGAPPDTAKEQRLANALLQRLGIYGAPVRVEGIPEGTAASVGGKTAGKFNFDTRVVSLSDGLKGPERIEVLSHELGHHIMATELGRQLEKANPELRRALDADYNAWVAKNFKSDSTVAEVNASRKPLFRGEKMLANDGLKYVSDLARAYGDKAADYLFNREEWVADHIARALTQKPETTTVIGRFFANIAEKLKAAYHALFGEKRNQYAIAPSIDKWVQGLLDREHQRLESARADINKDPRTVGRLDPVAHDLDFSAPRASVDTMDEVAKAPDEGRFQVAKDWLNGKAENMRPAALGALQRRHLTELMDSHQGLKGFGRQYDERVQKLDAERNAYVSGAHDAADHPEDMLKKGAAPIADDTQRYVRQKGLGGWLGRENPEAKDLGDVMNNATVLGLDPSRPYTKLMMEDSTGKTMPWTAQAIKERIAALRGQMRGRPGDSKAEMMREVKNLRSLPARERERIHNWPTLQAAYSKLSPEAKAIYAQHRDWYGQHRDATEVALIDKIEAVGRDMVAKGTGADMVKRYTQQMTQRIRQQFESNRLEGVYFPLNRDGDYWMSVSDKDGKQGFKMFESAEEAAAAERKLKAAGFKIEAQGRRDSDYRAKNAPSGTFVADIIQLLKKSGAPEKVQDEVYQSFLKSLPEMSMRKHSIHRKKIPGFENDALRAFSKNSFHGAHQLARLRNAHELQGIVEGAESKMDNYRRSGASTLDVAKGDALLGELKRRQDYIMNPKDSGLANLANSVGFIYFLGASPASALTNLTQNAQVTLPVLGAHHGWNRAAPALAAAMRDSIRTGGNIERTLKNPEERLAYSTLRERGDITKTQTHTLAGLAEGNRLSTHPAWAKTMTAMSYMFHKAEVVNRESAGMASYRLARKRGDNFNDAVQYASDIINGTHFDYSAANRPRYMQGGVQRAIGQFKNYSVGMTWLMYRALHQSFKGESPEARSIARKTLTGVLGTTALMAGTMGLPIYNLLKYGAQATHALFGDDEPYDFDTEYRKWLDENLGENAGGAVADGLVNKITGANLASRVSLSNLWYRDADRELEGADAYHNLLETIAGPLGGLTKNMYVGAQQAGEGNVWRGTETVMPKFVKDAMKATRFATEGANTLRGDPIVTDVTKPEEFIQALGFQPTRLFEQQEQNSALKNYEQQILNRRQTVVNAFAMASAMGDDDARTRALDLIHHFNDEYPEIALSSQSIRQSLNARARYSQQAEHGVFINKKLAGTLRDRVIGEGGDAAANSDR